ncbi:MAG: ATP-binding protein, partial [Chloroflexota bacterium]|nr:ATP-binding protein [Chloroflexota bacterium]
EAQERINMQDRLATVGKLAAGIGHDFNNIMAAILVYTELLLQEKNLPPMFEPRLNVIKQQIERASDLIRQMSDFSRSSVMEETQIDLLSFLKELEKLLSRTLPENIRITLRNKLGEYLVNVDPSRLQQIFMNLAVNSRDAMPTGGELSFDLTYFQCDEECDDSPFLSAGDWTKITVHDTGIGISEDALPHIFEPFFTTKEVGKGTGLGLAQVYGIIKQFDGHIEVESAEETGTTFTIFLPLVIASEGEYTEPQADITLDGTGQMVLLVEDNSPTRQALKAMLEMFGYQVTTASNGVEALNYLQTDDASFEFVVSDIVMPEMGGVELYHEIQAMWPDLKIIFVTGHPLHGQEKELLSQKTVSWLQKPFTIQNFSQIMEKLLKEDNA